MAKLTTKGGTGAERYHTSRSKAEVVQKLGMIEDRAEELVGMICDDCCRHPLDADADELESICAGCAASRLMEMIE